MATDSYLNYTGLAYYHNRLKTLFPSITDFNTLDDKVDGIISEGGEPNTIDTVKVNGTALVPDAQKTVNVIVPTLTSDLTNDSDFQTGQDVTDAIDAALADITGVSFEVVQTLPATGEAGVIYLLSNSGSAGNSYDEYVYVNNGWEKIGATDVDLSGYWATSDLTAITTAQIDTIAAS